MEIKSGKTITSDYYKGQVYWNKLTGNKGGTIVYGGDLKQIRSVGITVFPLQEIPF